MAKKEKVRYWYGSDTKYRALVKSDISEWTVCFVLPDGEAEDADGYPLPDITRPGRLYKGENCVGSTNASDIIVQPGEADIYTYDASTGKLISAPTTELMTLLAIVSANNSAIYAAVKSVDTAAIYEAIDEKVGEAADDIEKTVVENISNPDSSLYKEITSIATEIAEDAAKDAVSPLIVEDSSTSFPAQGSPDKIYVEDSLNKMYRYARKTPDSDEREYKPVSGGGGTASAIELKTNVFPKTPVISIASGASCTFEYAFSSANTFKEWDGEQFVTVQQQTGTVATAKFYIDGILYASDSNVKQSNYYADGSEENTYNSFTIPASKLTSSTHTVTIQCTDGENNTAQETITIKVVSVNITSPYTPAPVKIGDSFVVQYQVTSTSTAYLAYQIDNNDPIRQETITGQPAQLTISTDADTYSHGIHTLTMFAESFIEDVQVKTAVLSYDIIMYDEDSEVPILSASITNDLAYDETTNRYTLEQYNYATLTYQVWLNSKYNGADWTVRLMLDKGNVSTTVNTLTVNSSALRTWTYTFDDFGSFEMYIQVDYKGANGASKIANSDAVALTVKESANKLDAAPNSVLFLSAKNRSNGETAATRSVWESKQVVNGSTYSYAAQFANFDWTNNSGWYDHGNGLTSLRTSGDARCYIQFSPFARNSQVDGSNFAGRTIEIEFSTTNISNYDASIIRMYNGTTGYGIDIRANRLLFSTNEFSGASTDDENATGTISVPFKEDEKVRISIVLTDPNTDDHGNRENKVNVSTGTGNAPAVIDSVAAGWWKFIKIYINGICSFVTNYVNYNQFFINDTNIEIGSNDATVDIYTIRTYYNKLSDSNIVKNLVADTQNAADKLAIFKRNNITEDDDPYKISLTKLRQFIPCMLITCISDGTKDGYKNTNNILPTVKGDKRGVQAVFDCEGVKSSEDEAIRERYKFAYSFFAKNVQFDVQGTSSQYYPRKNWKLSLKTDKKKNILKTSYSELCATKKPTLLFWNTLNDPTTEMSYEDAINQYFEPDYILKNFKDNDEGKDIEHISSIPAKTFCLKADFAESSGVHNTGMAKYADFLLKSVNYLTPAQQAQYKIQNRITDVDIRTTVDGYPIAMFWRQTPDDDYQFYGKFNFNHDKGAENVFGFIDSIEGLINPNTGEEFLQFNEDYYDAIAPEFDDDENVISDDPKNKELRYAYEPPVECWEFLNNQSDLCLFKNVTSDTFDTSWFSSFENRHPDNDTLVYDYENGKIPPEWKKFVLWVSSTKTDGYASLEKYGPKYPVPTAWDGTYADLAAGEAGGDTKYAYYIGTLDDLNQDSEADINIVYILYPEISEGEPDTDYALYGHKAVYDKDTLSWVDDGEYSQSVVADTSKIYYINDTDDTDNYRNIYAYNATSKTWVLRGNITDEPYVIDAENEIYDTAEYRINKFKSELGLYMNLSFTLAYYLITEHFANVDQRAKNMMFASWGYEQKATEEQIAAGDVKAVYKYENEGDDWVQKVAYYVPKNANYKWYPIFYDNDTELGLNNVGIIKFEPNVESLDVVGSGYAFNGADSTLWYNIGVAYEKELIDIYTTMRRSGNGLSYQSAQYYFTNTQSDCWSEMVYNLDGIFKYIEPATIGFLNYDYEETGASEGEAVSFRTANHLPRLQGSRAEHRKWWLNSRFIYSDSRYFAGDYKSQYVDLRLYTKGLKNASAAFNLTPYVDMYLTVKYTNDMYRVRAKRNQEYIITPTAGEFNDTETQIFGAPYILSMGKLYDKYVGRAEIQTASKITDLLFGIDYINGEPYSNKNIEAITVSAANRTLKNIDVRGCQNSAFLNMDLSELTLLETVKASNSSLTTIQLPRYSGLKYIEFPTVISDITFIGAPYLENVNIVYPTDFSKTSTLRIVDAPGVISNSWKLIETILGQANNNLTYIQLQGINWTIDTPDKFALWNDLMKLEGITDEGNKDYPVLTGTVTLVGPNFAISSGYIDAMTSMITSVGGSVEFVLKNMTEQALTGYEIDGPTNIPSNAKDVVGNPVYTTYTVEYLPDDYIETNAKGVKWTIPDVFEILEVFDGDKSNTAPYAKIRYNGVSNGLMSFPITVDGLHLAATKTLNITPSATLRGISLVYNGTPITTLNMTEGTVANLIVRFDTTADASEKDKKFAYSISSIGTSLNPSEYFSITANEIDGEITINALPTGKSAQFALRVYNTEMDSIGTTLTISTSAIYKRTFRLAMPTYYDADGNFIDTTMEGGDKAATAGTIFIDTIDGNPVDPMSNEKYRIPTDPDSGIAYIPVTGEGSEVFGTSMLTVHAQSNSEDAHMLTSCVPAEEVSGPFTISDSLIIDTINFDFFSPVPVTINVMSGGVIVNDAEFTIYSETNVAKRPQSSNNMKPPYNNVETVDGTGVIRLYANTPHNLVISEKTDDSANSKYKNANVVCNVGTSAMTLNVNVIKNYLKDVNDDVLSMVVEVSNTHKVVRLYLRTVANKSININWGDGKVEQFTKSTEGAIYHTYAEGNREYTISVPAADTSNIRWFHVAPSNASSMPVCVGSSTSSFPSWSSLTEPIGGIVAYQSSGGAYFMNADGEHIMPTFGLDNAAYKPYCRLAAVGNIYKNCVNATSAIGLFKNTTLGQLDENRPLLSACRNILSVKQIFMNTNLETVSSAIFYYLRNCVDYSEAFMGCKSLSRIAGISTEALASSIKFINPNVGVCVESCKNMFAGCSSFGGDAGYLPALWKQFYGYSFAINTAQQAFSGCTTAANYNSVPSSWGGIASEYTESNPKDLLFIVDSRALGAGVGKDTPLAYFKLNNIYPTVDYKYVIKFNPLQTLYEPSPIFGAGHTTGNLNVDPAYINSDNEEIDYVIDVARNIGTVYEHIYKPYVAYRNMGEAAGNFSVVTSALDGANPLAVITQDMSAIITMDMGYSSDGVVLFDYEYTTKASPFIPNGTKESKTGYYVSNAVEGVTMNLPLVLWSWYNRNAFDEQANNQPSLGQTNAIMEFKIYDANKAPVANIYPVYGKHPTTGEYGAYLYDSVTNTAYTMETTGTTVLTFIPKNV